MANLLTFERMQFLMDKLGRTIEDGGYKMYESGSDYVIDADLNAELHTDPCDKFFFIDERDFDKYNNLDYKYDVDIFFHDHGDTTHYVYIKPRTLREINARYPVGTKRVNQAICKVGGYSGRYKAYTSSRTGVSKSLCDCGVL